MSLTLHGLIREVRRAKSLAEERTVILRESAAIRQSFGSSDNQLGRARNLSKLLYINMLGYPTDFGHMVVLELTSSSDPKIKALGYLALPLMLHEDSEVLTLVEAQLDRDLQSSDMSIVALAVRAFADVATPSMAFSLSNRIADLLFTRPAGPDVRKVTAIAALRILDRHPTPDMLSLFLAQLPPRLLNDISEGVVLSSLALANFALHLPVLEVDAHRFAFADSIHEACSRLRTCNVAAPESVFIMTSLLQFLRSVAPAITSQSDSDAVAKVLGGLLSVLDTSTDSTATILYETIVTILALSAPAVSGTNGAPCGSPTSRGMAIATAVQPLAATAVESLSSFLNGPNNYRYVALTLLVKVVPRDRTAVQKHRNVIVECLKDADVSIRRRALDVIYALVTPSNVRLLIPDLLAYLPLAPPSLRGSLTERVCELIERLAPTPLWHVDALIRIITVAGGTVPVSAIDALIAAVSGAPQDVQAYTALRLFKCIRGTAVFTSHQPPAGSDAPKGEASLATKTLSECAPLVRAFMWCCGELFEPLMKSSTLAPDAYATIAATEGDVSADTIVDTAVTIATHATTPTELASLCCTTLAKLASKAPSPARESAKTTLASLARGSCGHAFYRGASLYEQLFTTAANDPSSSAALLSVLAPLPPMAPPEVSEINLSLWGGEGRTATPATAATQHSPTATAATQGGDIDDLFGGGGAPSAPPQPPIGGGNSVVESIDALWGGGGGPAGGGVGGGGVGGVGGGGVGGGGGGGGAAPSAGGVEYRALSSTMPSFPPTVPPSAAASMTAPAAPPPASETLPFDPFSSTQPSSVAAPPPQPAAPSSYSPPPTAPVPQPAPPPPVAVAPTPQPALPPAQSTAAAPTVALVVGTTDTYTVSFNVTLTERTSTHANVRVDAEVRNLSPAPLSDVALRAAVTKTSTVALDPISSPICPPGGVVTQTMRISTQLGGPKALMVRLNVKGTSPSKQIDDMVRFVRGGLWCCWIVL